SVLSWAMTRPGPTPVGEAAEAVEYTVETEPGTTRFLVPGSTTSLGSAPSPAVKFNVQKLMNWGLDGALVLVSKVWSCQVPLIIPWASSVWRNPLKLFTPKKPRASAWKLPRYGAEFALVPVVVGSKMLRVALSSNVVPSA